MNSDDPLKELERFAASYDVPGVRVRRVLVALDERQDGEEVTRVALLLPDPPGDTWDVDAVRALRQALGRKATELGLPAVSMTLVPQSEAELLDSLAG